MLWWWTKLDRADRKRWYRWFWFILLVGGGLWVYNWTSGGKLTTWASNLWYGTEVDQSKTTGGTATLRLVTWNLNHLGRSKSEEEVAFMAGQLVGHDVVAIQEIATRPHGAQGVARLVDALQRQGEHWDYIISDPTTGKASERYAFLWRTSQVRLLGPGWLASSLQDPIDREPFLARFEKDGRQILLATFHAVPSARSPHRECILLARIHEEYPDDHIVIAGDFNLAPSHQAFDALRQRGYVPVLVNQKTTLKRKRKDGQHLLNPYDNIFYETNELTVARAGILDFTTRFSTLKIARLISDHVPVYAELGWK